MTAVPEPPGRLLTVDAYTALGEDDPVTLIDCHLAGEFGYQDAGPVTGRFVTTEPFPVTLRLDGLLPG